jgi:hypothetical protein
MLGLSGSWVLYAWVFQRPQSPSDLCPEVRDQRDELVYPWERDSLVKFIKLDKWMKLPIFLVRPPLHRW